MDSPKSAPSENQPGEGESHPVRSTSQQNKAWTPFQGSAQFVSVRIVKTTISHLFRSRLRRPRGGWLPFLGTRARNRSIQIHGPVHLTCVRFRDSLSQTLPSLMKTKQSVLFFPMCLQYLQRSGASGIFFWVFDAKKARGHDPPLAPLTRTMFQCTLCRGVYSVHALENFVCF